MQTPDEFMRSLEESSEVIIKNRGDHHLRHSLHGMPARSKRAMVRRLVTSSRPQQGTQEAASKGPSAKRLILTQYLLQLSLVVLLGFASSQAQQVGTQAIATKLPDLVSHTSDEPVVAMVGQDAFLSCVAKNLQNYTIIWRFTNNAAPTTATSNSEDTTTTKPQQSQPISASKLASTFSEDIGQILTAGRQRVTSDERISVINSHDTWLLKISNVKLSDTGTYICYTNSEPQVRVPRILSVLKPNSKSQSEDAKLDQFEAIDYNFTDCCRAEYVLPRCQRLCSFQQLSSRYQSINIVHECFSMLPSITRCMVAGRNVTDCCAKRHIPSRCNPMCGHQGDTSAMSVQDQSYCADYSASIMSCVAEGVTKLPGQPELVIVEAVSSSTLKVSWQKVTDENEMRKIDGWIINLTKLSSFEDTISTTTSKSTTPNAVPSPTSNDGNSSSPSVISVSSSFSTSTSTSVTSSSGNTNSAATATSPGNSALSGLTIVDVADSASLASMTKLLAASSGTISLRVDKQANEYSIDNLKPYTVYQIQMFAFNSNGRSQLTDPIRALTLSPESELSSSSSADGADETYVEPSLPDTRKCCLDRGVTLKRCLDTLCDPVEADKATIADLMICAPWSNTTFQCLSSRVDHTECCKSRGVTPFCLSMCSGDIKRVDYRHFRCLTHMSTYTNCILDSHNVLPSPPQNFTVGPITHSWAVLNWRPPKKHARSLQGYRIFWRRVDPVSAANSNTTRSGNPSSPIDSSPTSSSIQMIGGDSAMFNDEFYYASAEAATNPYLLDALQANTVYETFAVSVNRFGQSESSARFIFQTLADPEEIAAKRNALAPSTSNNGIESLLPLHGNTKQDSVQTYYNETTCCANSGVHNACMQLCDYDLKVADVSSLITSCNTYMPVVLRCMAGSRNSVPCCRNRGVSDNCLNVCAGLTEHSPLVVATRCAPDFGKIIRCMDEGSKQIPSAPVDLHTKDIRPDQVTIKWTPASEDSLRSDIEYHVRYQRLQSMNQPQDSDSSSLIAVVPLHPLEHNLILTTNNTEATIDKLAPNARYSIYVTAENPYGISLPSLVLVIQTPSQESAATDDAFKRKATLGAPHSLEILRSDTESIVLKWLAPLFISNDAQIKYRIFYKLLGTQNSTAETDSAPSNGNGSVRQLSNNWTVIETPETNAVLRNLQYSSQYAITVQAFSYQMLGHMSEILLASTARPVPPTLNHPLVINNPIEGNNITIMCVALGQPVPQISMFINGLLVQKRTQPYVIYHLVNLVRGHLIITCYASNGHGKDYASVQSRTEVSVKFPSRATAKSKEITTLPSSTARMTCEITGNPQPTVVWTFTPQNSKGDGGSNRVMLLQANDRITTLLVSQFENPFTWTHTLTIRNVSTEDAGLYQCRARNVLYESVDSMRLKVSESGTLQGTNETASGQNSNLKIEPTSNLMDCCRSQNVSEKCLPVCSVDGLDVETAFKTPECQPHLDKLMFCAADGSDHRHCCRTRQVPFSCLRWCSGAKLNMPALCFLSSAMDINECFQAGRTMLPGPPRNVRLLLASDSEHNQPDVEAPEVATITTSGQMSMFPSQSQQQTVTSSETPAPNDNRTVIGPESTGSSPKPEDNTTLNNKENESAPIDSSTQRSEPMILEWDPPAKNPEKVQYYRVFWRRLNSPDLSRIITNMTWIKLHNLNMDLRYEFVVKAANQVGSSVYSEPLAVSPSEVLSQSQAVFGGDIWFIGPTTHIVNRIVSAICFATIFMFGILTLVLFLEKRGYLKRFASSKSNSSRVSFANPAYSKDSDNGLEGDNVSWETGHSLDVLGLPPQSSELTFTQQSDSPNQHK